MKTFNLILDTDSYKSGHFLQYPPKTSKLVAYLESRGGIYENTVFFGLQYILKKYVSQGISLSDVTEASDFFSYHKLPFNTTDWTYVAKNLQGRIPLRIYAVPEGSVIPTHNILMRIESTDPRCCWATTWFETLLMRVWYPTTVATVSWHARQLIGGYLKKSSDTPDREVSFKLHDFGARGVSSFESAGIGGAAHLVNFSGSDTIAGMLCANEYYHAQLAPSSIPAAEHSCIMVWGEKREGEAFAYILSRLSTISPLVAMPVDTYNFIHAVNVIWGKDMAQAVKKSGATIVLRTDSGVAEKAVLAVLRQADKTYGSALNKKGYKVLNGLRVLHSDNVHQETIKKVLSSMLKAGFSATNIVFGMGGALLQKVTRDTQKFAYKVSQAEVDGIALSIAKRPRTAKGKESKSGYLDLIKSPSGYETIDRNTNKKGKSELKLVFDNGKLLVDDRLDDIRARAALL